MLVHRQACHMDWIQLLLSERAVDTQHKQFVGESISNTIKLFILQLDRIFVSYEDYRVTFTVIHNCSSAKVFEEDSNTFTLN